MCAGRRTNHRFFHVYRDINMNFEKGQRSICTFLRSPFFHKYPALMTLSSTELRGLLARMSAVFHPPSTATSSSVSSPLSERRSAIDDKGGCDDEAPAWTPPAALEPPARGVDTSGVKIESESDSVPETGPVERFDGCHNLFYILVSKLDP